MEIQMHELVPKKDPAKTTLTPVTPNCVKNILQRDYNIDFTRYDKKMMEVI